MLLTASLAMPAIAQTPPPAPTAPVAAAVAAAPAAHPWARAFRRAKMAVVADRLGLTDEQRAKLKSLRADTRASIQAIRANTALTPEQKQAQVVEAWRAGRTRMRAVLTDQQQGRLAQILSEPRRLNVQARMRLRMGMVANRLGLSPDQRSKIHAMHAQLVAALKPIRADASLTPEQRQAKVRGLVQANREQIRGVLNADQQAHLARMRRRLLAPLGPLG